MFLGNEKPSEALADFQYANPAFPLNHNLPKSDPLKALEAVLKMKSQSLLNCCDPLETEGRETA